MDPNTSTLKVPKAAFRPNRKKSKNYSCKKVRTSYIFAGFRRFQIVPENTLFSGKIPRENGWRYQREF